MSQHTHDDNKLTKEIERVSSTIKQAEKLKIQSETQLETMRSQYKKVETEIKGMGVDPKKAEEALSVMDKEMAELLAEITALLPQA